ncbi:hypothetical protein [Streptomyces caniscabiei]|uniref:hypothetical protein n=1 Tax=Streptomyces caniscabiei TaxID=2746961 RepID=UPI0038F81145
MSGPHDFDFFHGEWEAHHRRRTDFLAPDSAWEEFTSTSWCRPLFDGAANIEEIDLPHLGSKGLTLRLFDTEARTWSLNGSSSRSGRLFPPVVGQFTGGRGAFHGDDVHDGKDVRVRFVWSDTTATSARWEQAFSLDDGASWLTNWVMEFSRPQGPAASGTPAG